MDLRIYLDILKRRALIIAIVTLVAVLVLIVVENFIVGYVYTASTTINVVPDVGVANSGLYPDYTVRLLNTYAYILQSYPFLEAAVKLLPPRDGKITPGDLKTKIKINVDILLNTSILSITVQSPNPVLSEDLANTMAILLVGEGQNYLLGSSKSTLKVLEEQLADLEKDLNNTRQQIIQLQSQGKNSAESVVLDQQITSKQDAYTSLLNRYELQKAITSLQANSLTVVSPAALPLTPSNNVGLSQIALAIVIGLFGGLGTALVIENLDTSIYELEQLERLTSLPVFGTVPPGWLRTLKSGGKDKINEKLLDAYRLLAINLQSTLDVSTKTILITSAIARDGKSTLAVNLSLAISEAGQPVYLVEGNLRHPTLEKFFGFENNMGLATLLENRTPLTNELTVKFIHPLMKLNLWVIGSGPKVPHPVALLASPRMCAILDYLRTQGKMVILDAPPVLGMADVAVLAPQMDGVIIAVRKGWTKREQILSTVKQLQTSHAHILGFVFLAR